MGTDIRHLDVDGARLLVELTGSGPALILLHGWTLDHRMWRHQVGPLSGQYQVIAPDRRGWGKSTGTPDLAREVDDVIPLLDHLGIERATLCAASQAGRVALRFALQNPERLSALILQGAALDGMPEPADDPGFVPVADYAALLQAGKEREFQRRWLAHPFMSVPDSRPDLRREIAEMVEQCPLRDLRGQAAPAQTLDITGRLDRITTPTLIITGSAETPHRRRIAATLLERIPGARHGEIPGGGHLVNMIAPAEYNRAVREFLA
jgi:pimeloyl-ACP methyl ester carboxylesterase